MLLLFRFTLLLAFNPPHKSHHMRQKSTETKQSLRSYRHTYQLHHPRRHVPFRPRATPREPPPGGDSYLSSIQRS